MEAAAVEPDLRPGRPSAQISRPPPEVQSQPHVAPPARRAWHRSRVAAVVAWSALLLAGCVTDDQVKSIVRDGNYQLLLAADPALETGGLATNPEKENGASVDVAAAKLEAFLAQHQDDPAMASALRLRQALLYLNHRSFALAENAFGQVNPATLHSTRDRALYAARNELRWWTEYAQSKPAAFASNQKPAAEKAMLALLHQSQSQELAASPDLRNYFLEMRAWIGLKLGLATADADTSRQTLQDAIDVYAANFTPAELSLLGSTDLKDVQPFDLSTRRVLRARSLLTTLAQATAGAPNARLTFSQPAFQRYYDALPH